MPLLGHRLTERSIGLAPEIPEDLYMLIKKVRYNYTFHCSHLANTIDPGRRRPQAPRAQPQGQGQQIPPHSDRVPYSPSVALLQDRRCPPTNLEIRERHRLYPRRISVANAGSGIWLHQSKKGKHGVREIYHRAGRHQAHRGDGYGQGRKRPQGASIATNFKIKDFTRHPPSKNFSNF